MVFFYVMCVFVCHVFSYVMYFRMSCVFVSHVFSYQPFYFDFHSARIIFDVSSGFYLWNVNSTTT